jgi:hypothetical protein
MTTARSSHPCRVRMSVMFVAQAALPFVGENRRLTRFGVSTAGLPTSSGACDSHAARRARSLTSGGPPDARYTCRPPPGDR